MASILPIPPNYASAIPYLTVKGAAKAIDFYKKAYGAELVSLMDMPGGGNACRNVWWMTKILAGIAKL
ncbi:hypothetical protein [Arsukibacterium indicum]|uniref:Glyoxalase/fosfomycin resistance/dioxygenase domain-containing protein n=1 Tax=Arsukibacterium indicum TaxID=2848612 RepID=A0ABS6MFP0_9GAMM|nr:hypothetical protein [Arsukibacterium indicum]MBV2127619.1 hypothetical protein [Arsukibacterium indicum]